MALTIDGLLRSLALEPTGEGAFHAENAETGHPVVFGGQLLAQSVVAGLTHAPDKRVKTVHTIFARGASPDTGIDITVDPMHAGRALASCSVTLSQGDTLCARSLVLLSSDEPDFIRHAEPGPDAGKPDDAPVGGESGSAWEIRIVDGVDISAPEAVGPPDLDVWTRFVGAPADPGVDQALLAFATDGFLIGTAMRPHEGVGQSQAHVTLSTGVLSHTLTFHEPAPAADWLLLSHHSVHAGHGRTYGRADVFTDSGGLVASYVQDAMIRARGDRAPGKL